ncbi:hypothetical protein PMAYCL1PPCAC_13224 [Pristionchus mayeri]|uniref:G-protein coupled receptors family 1 profile domain-containing protein n=1 Tax=Pristionchus mayeri TaxID=1317129 RepID=A0AAN4ZNB1_9BILA|nr:hypothetical protein PMAYCL1PPCAC_13224 [Pristionchus mayeri]
MDVVYDDPFWPFKPPENTDFYYKRDTVAALSTPSTSNSTFAILTSIPPPIFQGCSNYRPGGSDDKYGNCNVSDPVEACRLLGKLHEVKEYRTYFLAIVPVILSVFAFLFNALFLFLQWMVWRKAGSGHRKRYALILFRSFTSLLTLLCFYILLIVWQGGGLNYASVAVFIFIGSHDFFCIASTYLVLTGILYTAVVHPIFYKLKFRLVHCYAIVGCIYLVTMILSVCFGLFEASLFYPDTTPIPCPVDSCGFPVAIVIVVLLALGSLTVVLLYIILLLRMRSRNRAELRTASVKSNESRTSQKRSSVVAMNRLAINMATFTIATMPLLAISIYTLVNFSNLSTLGQGEKSPCKTYLNSDLFVELELLASAAALIWVLSMVIDPVVNMLADPKLVEETKRIGGRIKEKVTCRFSNER